MTACGGLDIWPMRCFKQERLRHMVAYWRPLRNGATLAARMVGATRYFTRSTHG